MEEENSKVRLTFGMLLAYLYKCYEANPELGNMEIFFRVNYDNGDIRCCAHDDKDGKNYKIFSNVDDGVDFLVLKDFKLSDKQKELVGKIAKDMKQEKVENGQLKKLQPDVASEVFKEFYNN